MLARCVAFEAQRFSVSTSKNKTKKILFIKEIMHVSLGLPLLYVVGPTASLSLSLSTQVPLRVCDEK